MLRYRPQPPRPRRPKAAPDRRFAARLMAVWRQVGPDAAQLVLFPALAVMAFAWLASVALANPAPVAVPGDVVEIGGGAAWPAVQDDILGHVLANPWTKDGRACMLDIAFMARNGGVLTVMAVRQDGVMLAWAGGPTARGAQACLAGSGGVLIPVVQYQGLLVHLTPRH